MQSCNVQAGVLQLLSKDGTAFPVKSQLLWVRSPAFRNLLQESVSSSTTWNSNLSSRTLKIGLRFLETGKLTEGWSEPEVLEELTYASHRYYLEDLQQFLDQALGQVCTEETVGKLLVMATRFEMKQAQRDLRQFIIEKKGVLEHIVMSADDKHQRSDCNYQKLSTKFGWKNLKVAFRNKIYN